MIHIFRFAALVAFILIFTKLVLPTTIDVMVENARVPMKNDLR